MTSRTESCPACGDYDEGECPMCAGEGFIDELVNMDVLSQHDDEDERR